MMNLVSHVAAFLQSHCPSSAPLLLALSGGADSLCLFYCLLAYRDRYRLPFHVAHVDHGWRSESYIEAQKLRQLAAHHEVPFYLKELEPSTLQGNLEAACRKERYNFFADLCDQYHFQGVLTGHHQNDQAETIFKRILEGAHWSRWMGLQPFSQWGEISIYRPLLNVSKSSIEQMLAHMEVVPFDDPTNRQVSYLRARFRASFFPRLNEEFGKDVQGSLIQIGQEAQELTSYFAQLLNPLLMKVKRGPWGCFLDLQGEEPLSHVEMKFLLRLLCRAEDFYLSREIIEQAARALHRGVANRRFEMGQQKVIIDRKRIFILCAEAALNKKKWQVEMIEERYMKPGPMTSWKEGWSGNIVCYLPRRNYRVAWDVDEQTRPFLKTRWSKAKVPAFLYPYFPLIWDEDTICHEFLTGKSFNDLKEGELCLKILLTYA